MRGITQPGDAGLFSEVLTRLCSTQPLTERVSVEAFVVVWPVPFSRYSSALGTYGTAVLPIRLAEH